MHIDIEKLNQLYPQADKILFNPEAESVLIQLLEIQEQVEVAIKAAKQKLEEAALKINPNFSSLHADKVKVFYRAYGEKYAIDESLITEIPEVFYEKQMKYKPKVDEIDDYQKKSHALPYGVKLRDRQKSISFSFKNKGHEN